MKTKSLLLISGRFAALIAMAVLMIGMIGVGGCTAVQSPIQNDLTVTGGDGSSSSILSNTGQNTQLWPDGSGQTGSTQLDSGVIGVETTNWQGTAVSAILALGKNGAQVKNPGNLSADSLSISFGDPYTEPDGSTIVPIQSIEITNLINEVTTVIQASTEQVALWTAQLAPLADAQQKAIIAALERDKVITQETAGLIRAGLEALTPVP